MTVLTPLQSRPRQEPEAGRRRSSARESLVQMPRSPERGGCARGGSSGLETRVHPSTASGYLYSLLRVSQSLLLPFHLLILPLP